MEKTLGAFKAQQSQALEILKRLQAFLQQGEGLGVQIDPKLKTKLQTVIQGVAGDKLKIALVGGFSEGKTSIAAAWMEQLDKSSMKISHQESSNEVTVHDAGSDLVLIDTPGLFGFREQINAETGSIEKYKDITKKYVSEAHLVLYVMNSTNPIKESHKDDLNWLFRTLNLLSRTVFVLSRFDEVVDVSEEDEYQANLKVKQANVTERLRDLIDLDPTEAEDLAIIAVAANPFDLGTEYWLENLEKFQKLSHIATLQEATSRKIKDNGGAAAIVEETKNSIIRDILDKQLPIAVLNDEKIGEEVDKLEVISARLGKQLISTNAQIVDVKGSLRQFVVDYFTDLILQAKGLSQETFAEFFEREVGSEGVVIKTRLQNEFDRQLRAVTLEVSKMKVGFDTEINHFNTAVKVLGKQGLNYVLKGNLINNGAVLATRDGVVAVVKAVGLDLGKMLKFKPWGAVNFAKGLNGALAGVGFAMEVWDTIEQANRERVFRERLDKMVKNFEAQRAETLELINGPKFIETFFADYIDLQITVIGVQEDLVKRQKQRQQFHEWREMGDAIKREFTLIHR